MLSCRKMQFYAVKTRTDVAYFEVWTVLLRSYPVPFGLRVQRCFPDFCRDAARPQVAEPEDAPQLFHSTELGDTWPEADLISACIYLRGSQHLRVSERWKAAFPTSMWADSPSFLVP